MRRAGAVGWAESRFIGMSPTFVLAANTANRANRKRWDSQTALVPAYKAIGTKPKR